jgi:hypothetical protein
MRNQLEKHFQCERCHKHNCQTNQEHENLICEKAHQDQHQQAKKQRADCTSIYPQERLIKVKQSFTLMTSVASTLPFLSSSKVTYSLCGRGVRLENHFLFLVICVEQPESMSHVSSKPPSITYIG